MYPLETCEVFFKAGKYLDDPTYKDAMISISRLMPVRKTTLHLIMYSKQYILKDLTSEQEIDAINKFCEIVDGLPQECKQAWLDEWRRSEG